MRETREERVKKIYESIDTVWHAILRGCDEPDDEDAAFEEFNDLIHQLSSTSSIFTSVTSPAREAVMRYGMTLGRKVPEDPAS